MKRPLPMVAVFYVAGILLATLVPFRWDWLCALSLALAAATLALPRARPFLLWPLLVLTGWTNLAWRTAILSPCDLRRMVAGQTEWVSLEGRLCATPTQRVYERDQRDSWRTIAEVQVRALRRVDHWQPASGRVAISTPGILGPQFFGGQLIEVSGVLRPPQGPVAEGLFDYRSYLRWQGIYYQLKVDSTNEWRVITQPAQTASPPISDRFCKWAQATLGRGLPVEDEALHLLWAMALGWKTALTDEVSEPFMRTGTMHIFAISGLHIALIAGILVSVLRVLRIPRSACGWLVIPLIWFYTAATGWQSSAIRSSLMMSIVIAGWALERPGDLLNSLAAAGFILLLWEPRQLFQASFQLSFFVVLSIALLLPSLEQARQRWLKTDPLLPDELRPGWHRWLDRPIRYLTSSLATSLAAWIGSLPLIAGYFHLFTPISLLANLVIVPLSGLALMCNLGSLICGSWLAPLTVLFNHSGWFWMHLMIRLSEWLAALPGSFFYIRAPSPVELVVYYLLVFALLTGWLLAPRRRMGAVCAMVLLLGLWFGQGYRQRDRVCLTVLAVGGGDALFIDAAGHADDMLIDCGSASAADYVVKPFLCAQGINWLTRCLLTHGDLRHIGGAPAITEAFSVRELVTSSVPFRSPAYRELVGQWEQSHRPWRQVNRGDRIGCWTLLHPAAPGRSSVADDNAVVLRGQVHGLRLLLCSDLGNAGQNALIDSGDDLKADVVVTGLPSNGEPVNNFLLDAVGPRALIVSTGAFPANEQAKTALRQRLERRGIPVIYTGDAGSVTLRVHRQGWELRAMDGTTLSGGPGSASEPRPVKP